ncbi:NRDE family protein [Legionella antarctica]|nr:NRDE family protein [Legionella antarctica]
MIALDQHPLYPIIILSNRDEFYKRATDPARYWQENSNVFSGKDLMRGGTWLGVNRDGKFSLITNYRSPDGYRLSMQSRGLLAKKFLFESKDTSPSAYVKTIEAVANTYNPFNMIVGDRTNVVYYSNVINKTTDLISGLYGISNHLLDTPWYKVLKAKNLFNHLLVDLITYEDPGMIAKMLYPILEDRTLAPDNLLPNTGVPMNVEKSLSSIFVDIPGQAYGTRSATMILFKKKNIFFFEKTFTNGKLISFNSTNLRTG